MSAAAWGLGALAAAFWACTAIGAYQLGHRHGWDACDQACAVPHPSGDHTCVRDGGHRGRHECCDERWSDDAVSVSAREGLAEAGSALDDVPPADWRANDASTLRFPPAVRHDEQRAVGAADLPPVPALDPFWDESVSNAALLQVVPQPEIPPLGLGHTDTWRSDMWHQHASTLARWELGNDLDAEWFRQDVAAFDAYVVAWGEQARESLVPAWTRARHMLEGVA